VVARVVERDGGGPVTTVAVEVEIGASPEQVWAVVSDPRNLPHWDKHIVEVVGVPLGGLAQGTKYITVMKFMAVRARVAAEVLRWDPPHVSSIRLSGVIDATVTTTVEALGDRRSRLRHQVGYRFRGGPLGKVAARSTALVGGAQFALRRGALAQKRQIEALA
jgi:uncharacterized protein YndB with AHSA1/START domain